MRPPPKEVHILLPVWGARYVCQCLDFCLPSVLADGNLPAVVRQLPCTLVILTRAADIAVLESRTVLAELRRHCAVRFELIDDLVSQANSTVLTLAYARAIRQTEAAATEIAFVFLVSDYLVADGSLSNVVRHVADGASGILAGNFQVKVEAIAPLLPVKGSPSTEALRVNSRALVAASLDALHPSTQADLAENRLVHDAELNRLFWRAGEMALVGRFYLMHMIAIRPETSDFQVHGPSDFSLIPELCPSGNLVTMTDSDDYLVVELQCGSDRHPKLGLGAATPARVASSIVGWATKQHRANASSAVIFHTGEVGRDVAEAVIRSGRFVDAVAARLAGPAAADRHHPFWTGALEHHRATARTELPADQLSYLTGAHHSAEAPAPIVSRLRKALVGRGPFVRAWHPRYVEARAVKRLLESLSAGARVLIVSDEPAVVRAMLTDVARAAGAASVRHLDLAAMSLDIIPAGEPIDSCLLLAGSAPNKASFGSIDAVAPRLSGRGCLALIVGEAFEDDVVALDSPAFGALEAALYDRRGAVTLGNVEVVRCSAWRIGVQRTMMSVVRNGFRQGGLRAVLGLSGATCLAVLSLVINLFNVGRTGLNGAADLSLLRLDLRHTTPGLGVDAAPRGRHTAERSYGSSLVAPALSMPRCASDSRVGAAFHSLPRLRRAARFGRLSRTEGTST